MPERGYPWCPLLSGPCNMYMAPEQLCRCCLAVYDEVRRIREEDAKKCNAAVELAYSKGYQAGQGLKG